MSMVDPSIDKLAEMVDSKYTLAILAAKRARELTKPGKSQGEKEVGEKEVSIALKEVGERKITYTRKK
ncbi:MAG: DNA-directed RNA polymerase subunit omega [Acidaminococcaceae bacterium]|nr:DNA-directed RNA polymerase subunit omega [Acidaminococcaceae bacterium]HBX74895.1 DNA-directed RNA polymerase subunit omega [Acidaminococcaceae bacterium]